jgi:cytochrome c oxidase cbb3-type subunit 3
MMIVREHGQRLFGDNCAACHGMDAKGVKGFPDLTDKDWLWGGDPDTIAQTIRVGVNSAQHPETRVSQMMAFGRDGILDDDSVLAVADYVKSLSAPSWIKGRAKSVAQGRTVFAENCVVCHGPEGHGNQALGVPNLADAAWLYGSDIGTIQDVIYDGRQGEMPAWGHRFSPVEVKLLTIYLLDKGDRR